MICSLIFNFTCIENNTLFTSNYCFYSQLDDSEASVTTSRSAEEEENNTNTIDTFDIVVHRVVDHSEIPQHTKFGCELTIPGTEYKEIKESPYKHRGGRK